MSIPTNSNFGQFGGFQHDPTKQMGAPGMGSMMGMQMMGKSITLNLF